MDKQEIIPKDKTITDAVSLGAKHDYRKKKSMEYSTGLSLAAFRKDSSCKPQKRTFVQWYENNPTLLEAEKAAMKIRFPNFILGKLDDGRLYWEGELVPGFYARKFKQKKSYYVLAVYQSNHPNQQIEPSVFVYIVYPEVHDLERDLGGSIPFIMKDSYGEFYFRTWEPNVVQTGHCVTTAASVLCRTTALLCAYELVLTGDLDYQTFLNSL